MITVPLNLVRLTILVGFLALGLLCLGVAGLLAFSGYLVYLVGSTKGALACWAAACCPLVFLGLVGASLPAWMRHRAPAGASTPTPSDQAAGLLASALSRASHRPSPAPEAQP